MTFVSLFERLYVLIKYRTVLIHKFYDILPTLIIIAKLVYLVLFFRPYSIDFGVKSASYSILQDKFQYDLQVIYEVENHFAKYRITENF